MNADKVSAYKVAKDVLPLGTSYEVVWRLALWFLDVELDSDLTASSEIGFARVSRRINRARGR